QGFAEQLRAGDHPRTLVLRQGSDLGPLLRAGLLLAQQGASLSNGLRDGGRLEGFDLIVKGLLLCLQTSQPAIGATTGGGGQAAIEIAAESDRDQCLDGILIRRPACLVEAIEAPELRLGQTCPRAVAQSSGRCSSLAKVCREDDL